jgi:cellulose synthase/poly-beta-1,6-N-acetylglucosamine synthase-like glycosyltransferase
MRAMRVFVRIIGVAFMAVQALWLALSLYHTAIAVIGRARGRTPRARRIATPRFFIAICARNEEQVVARIVSDLKSQTYPADLYELLVVAHNCTDSTARVAREAGARVLELETERPGKAAAIRAALEWMPNQFDLLGVFDADARIPAGLLSEVAAASPGEDCLQVETVAHFTGEWLGEGYGLGRRVRNAFWWRPREAVGLGTTISGCGWFVRPNVARELLPALRTLTEDLEFTARLAASGRKVAYVSSTWVTVEEAQQLGSSVHQRARWARGHLLVVLHEWPAIVRRALHGDLRALDMALYLIAPTRMLTRAAVSISFVLSLVAAPFALPLAPVTAAFAGEWLLPLVISVRDGLVPPTRRGVLTAVRLSLLNLLWFPIGLWALVTPRSRTWKAVPRAEPEDSDVVPAL